MGTCTIKHLQIHQTTSAVLPQNAPVSRRIYPRFSPMQILPIITSINRPVRSQTIA